MVNNAKVSLDLTCSLPVQTKLVDIQQRNFDAIDDLYKLKGNPECNDQLQPGFETDMTWVYLVPESATVIGWGVRDTTDLYNAGDYTTVQFNAYLRRLALHTLSGLPKCVRRQPSALTPVELLPDELSGPVRTPANETTDGHLPPRSRAQAARWADCPLPCRREDS